MHNALKIVAISVTTLVLVVGGSATWYIHRKQPTRSGTVVLRQLQAPVNVSYDERGVPHIRAENELDMYRALGYVHAQDRLFQMEMVRRLAQGELAEVLGSKLLDTDKLFRMLGIRAHAEQTVRQLDPTKPSTLALMAYLDGINQFQSGHPAPLEFDLLGIPKRPFTPQDTFAVAGYMAYSFAAALKTEPVLTYIRDKLGPAYLRIFDLEWHPEGVLEQSTTAKSALSTTLALNTKDWQGLDRLAQLSDEAMATAGVPVFEGSNAWAISGKRTLSGKPLLAGDPHIAYSAPAVWYEAHLSSPGFDLYGHYQALNPMALLGHNTQFGWTLTMFQNDDMDLIAEKTNPINPNQVWVKGQWVNLKTRTETIAVKGEPPVELHIRNSPHGPLINVALSNSLGTTPIAVWWAFLETENPILDAFYALNRADTLDKARLAAEKIHAPGLNVVWANAKGNIGWWAAAKLPIRPPGVNPSFILDGSTADAEKLGFYRFADNPQEENPLRGYIVSANQQPLPRSGVPVAGYYNAPWRAQRLNAALGNTEHKWNMQDSQALQLNIGSEYGPRMLKEMLPILKAVITEPYQKTFLEPLELWDGIYTQDSIAALLFSQMLYELAHATMADKLGEVQFKNLLKTRALDTALLRLVADPKSPWWGNVNTKQVGNRFEIMRVVWSNTLKHLESLYGTDLLQWQWGKAHTLTHNPVLGSQWPLNLLFNVGPFSVPGGRETLNNFSTNIGPAPWAVNYGPSTRRVIDFADASKATGINPVGQSGVLFDAHYADQAPLYIKGLYVPQHLATSDVQVHTYSQLTLLPVATQ